MMKFDSERVRANVRQASTEDLLDRLTVYRAEIEPAAVDLIEAELRQRGVVPRQIDEHAERRERAALLRPDGTAVRCHLCRRPAVTTHRGWHRLWRVLPLFPRTFAYCEEHRPR
jgi:hypothetical protein